MRILRLIALFFLVCTLAYAESGWQGDQARDIRVDTTNFTTNLSAADTDVQTALETLDVLAGGGSGDVTSVGDCTTGACLDGTSDGGTWIKFYDAQGAGQLITGNLTAARVWTLPDETGTIVTSTTSGVFQAYDADLTTYAGITPSANAQTLLGQTFAQMQASLSVDDLITLSGMAEGSVNLSTFTGSTISDNVTVKAALQALETSVETKDSVTTAGRSLTRSTNDFAADAETYTDTKCIYWENPVATDDFKSIWLAKQACTITSIWAESDQTVTFMIQVDDGSAADVDSVDLAPAAGTAEDTSLDGDTTMAAGDRLDMAITSVANTPTWCSVCFTFAYDD